MLRAWAEALELPQFLLAVPDLLLEEGDFPPAPFGHCSRNRGKQPRLDGVVLQNVYQLDIAGGDARLHQPRVDRLHPESLATLRVGRSIVGLQPTVTRPVGNARYELRRGRAQRLGEPNEQIVVLDWRVRRTEEENL